MLVQAVTETMESISNLIKKRKSQIKKEEDMHKIISSNYVQKNTKCLPKILALMRTEKALRDKINTRT